MLCALGTAVPGWAASQGSPLEHAPIAEVLREKGDIENTFEACRGVRVISKDTYLKDQARWDREIRNCQGKLQVGLGVGYLDFSISDLSEKVLALDVMDRAAEVTQKFLRDNLEYMRRAQLCFSKSLSKDQGEGCDVIRTDVRNTLSSVSKLARHQLILADIHRETPLVFSDPGSPSNVNSKLRVVEPGIFPELPQSLSYPSASAREVDEAIRLRKIEIATIEAELRKAKSDQIQKKGSVTPALVTPADEGQFQSAALRQLARMHAQEFARLTRSVPLFLTLPKSAKLDGDGGLLWDDRAIAEGFLGAIKNSTAELETATRARQSKTLEFSRWNGQSLTRELFSGERDLLSYVLFKPIMEEVLKADPSACRVAESLAAHKSYKATQTEVGISLPLALLGFGSMAEVFMLGRAATLAGAARTTAVAAKAGEIAGATVAATQGAATGAAVTAMVTAEGASATAAMMGPVTLASFGAGGAIGTYQLKDVFHRRGSAKQASEVKTGTNPIERDIADESLMSSVNKDLLFESALYPLTFLGGKQAARYILDGGGRSFLPQSIQTRLLQMEKLAASSQNGEIAKRTIAEVSKTVLGRAPTHQENALIGQIINRMGEEGLLSTPDGWQRMQKIIQAMTKTPPKSAQEALALELATRDLLAMDSSAFQGMKSDGFEGVRHVWEQYSARLRGKSPEVLQAMRQDPRAREVVLAETLRIDYGVTDPEVLRDMTACLFRGN